MTEAQKVIAMAERVRSEAMALLARDDLPSDVRTSAKVAQSMIETGIFMAGQGEYHYAMLAIGTASEALEAAKRFDQFAKLWPDAKSGRKGKQQRSDAGKKRKRRHWAELLADQISAWDEIPESLCPLEIDTLQADLLIYRDGDKVVCAVDGSESHLARSSFEKRYLGPALRKRGQKRR